MSKRFKDAATAQSGACNPIPIASALVNALAECYAERVPSAEDPAVFLILHQLTYLLTDHDFVMSTARLGERYAESMNAVQQKLKED